MYTSCPVRGSMAGCSVMISSLMGFGVLFCRRLVSPLDTNPPVGAGSGGAGNWFTEHQPTQEAAKTMRPHNRASRARTSFAAEPIPGTPWAIADTVLETLNQELAVPAPERGAALIGAQHSRMIIDAVVDPRPGEPGSYWHSDQLRERLSAYLSQHPRRRYVGTVHSHPGGYAEPSGPDHEAFANMLQTNPAVREALFPIVVQARRSSLGNVLRLGDDHLVELPHGTFAGYSAHPGQSGLTVRPAPMHVIPARLHCDAVVAELSEQLEQPVSVEWGEPMTVSGTTFVTALFVTNGRTVAGVAFGPSYPLTPPMVWSAESSSPTFSAWPISATGHDLAAAVSDVVSVRPAQSSPATVSEIRDGIQERLSVHVPHRIDAHVLLVGAGSVGSNAAEMLVRSGVRRLTVVDFDTVEAANLSRTIYTSADLGKPKTRATQERLTAIAPDLDLTLITSPMQGLAGELLDGIDLAFFGSDDLEGEGWLNHELYIRGIPLVSVKLFAGAEGAELAYVVPARDTACLRCITGALGSDGRGDVDYGTGRINGSPALGPDILAATARGVKVAVALTQPSGPLANWVSALIDRRLTYYLSSNVAGWKYLELIHTDSLPFDGTWLVAPGRADCEICGADRAADTQPARVPEMTAEPPSDESVAVIEAIQDGEETRC